ncbi:MAG TPA: cytidine deaminase [Acidimicrobiia bacterium]|jgi:cytidine deaminase|nr:cytidine deaminase [Acidimicrobiia bacterium]HKZ18767.1 cytidine deaminase [Acidimicrobiia bacterium]
MTTDDETLAAMAREAALGAYAPYSNFRVGAALLGADGRIFTGANIENAAYPASNCAEATAVGTAVSAGVRQVEKIAVACIDAPSLEAAYPCGRCRQILSEFGTQRVLVTTAEPDTREHSLSELLPHQFKL